MTVLLAIIASLVFSAAAASLVINVRELKWRADIQTYEGAKKLDKLGYEKLILERYRAKSHHRTYRSESDYIAVPLDAPMREGRKLKENWILINGLSSIVDSSVFASDPPFDELRVYGIKDGERHLVRTYAYYPENYRDVSARIEAYNAKRSAQEGGKKLRGKKELRRMN